MLYVVIIRVFYYFVGGLYIFIFRGIGHRLTSCLALPGHNFELVKPDYLKPQSSIWQLSKNLQQMRNGRIPNLGNHQMAGEYPKAGDKRPHKLTECEKKKVSATWGSIWEHSGAFGSIWKVY